jgi:hypothetical protein
MVCQFDESRMTRLRLTQRPEKSRCLLEIAGRNARVDLSNKLVSPCAFRSCFLFGRSDFAPFDSREQEKDRSNAGE